MDMNVYLAFVFATVVMIFLPGPSVLLTVAHSISYGWQRAISTVSGATVGIAVQLVIAAIGLATLLNTVAEAFRWLRWGGAVYLVYLGIKQWMNADALLEISAPSGSNKKLFLQGLTVTVFNPKSLIFIAAFLPQFIDTTRPLAVQFVLIVPSFLIIAFSITSIWAYVAGKASGLIKSKRAIKPVLRGAGGLMVVAGLALAMAHRNN